MVVNFSNTTVVVDASLKAPVLKLTRVGCRSSIAEYCRIGNGYEHIVVLLEESLHSTSEMIVEETEVERHVVVLDALPLTCCRSKLAVSGYVGELVAAYISTVERMEIVELVAVVVVDTALRTHFGIRCTQLKVAQPLYILKESFLVDAPSDRCSPEESPAILWHKLRAAVVTTVEFEQILRVEVVVQASEVRHNGVAISVLLVARQSKCAVAVDNVESVENISIVGSKHLVVLQLVLSAKRQTCVVLAGKGLMTVEEARYAVEVGARRCLLEVRLSLCRILQGLSGSSIIIICDSVLYGASTCLACVVAHVDVGIEPVGDVCLKRLADVEGANRQLIVATHTEFCHRRAPCTPSVRLPVACCEGQTRHRHGCCKRRTNQSWSHLLLSAISNAALKGEDAVELVAVVPAYVVSLIVVVAIL